MSPLSMCVLVVSSVVVLLVPRLLRFIRYRERLRHGPCCWLPSKPKYSFDPKYDLDGGLIVAFGHLDPESEAQLEDLEIQTQDQERYECLIGQPGLSSEERVELKAAYQEQKATRLLKQFQREDKFRAEREAIVAQQMQQWATMKQIAATKSLWWQFWNCS